MAASLRTARKCFCTVKDYSSPHTVFKRHNYIVLLPEVPNDTADSNPLLDTSSLPQFTKITPSNYYNGVTKTLLQYETGVKALEDKCQSDRGFEKSFNNLVEPIEELLVPFDNTWSTLKHIVAVKHSEPNAKIFWNLQPRVESSRTSHFHSKPIYHAFKEVNADKDQLSIAQRRVVNKYLLEAKLGGIELSGLTLEQFKKVHLTLENEKKLYKVKLHEATKIFKHEINDAGIVRDFPPELLHALAHNKLQPSKGPWNVTLQDDVYNLFMQYCPDRDVRWSAFNGRVTRSSLANKHLSNSLHIEEIRFNRRTQANMLGFDHFVDMSMQTKMAQSIDNVDSMIATLKVNAKPIMEKQVEDLSEFASQSGFDESLQLWDVPYWRRKQCISKYQLDADQIRTYFPLEKVLCGLFELCHDLFGITIVESDQNVNVWDNRVKFYDVIQDGKHCASFYYDMYARPNEKLAGCWLDVATNRCDSVGAKPIAYLVSNLCPPLANQPSLLSFDEVQSLFEQFGKALQHMLTQVPYLEVSGLSNIEWDAVDVPAHFMGSWLDNYSVIKMISCHFEEQCPLPENLFHKILDERRHMSSYDLMHQLYIADFDMKAYSTKEFWLDISRRLWPEYHSFGLQKNDCHPCSLPIIFCDEYPAAYFSFLWSKMIAADIYDAFKEVDCNDKTKLRQLGIRFKECFLSLGGGCHSSEIFRMFRGRDPSADALINKYT